MAGDPYKHFRVEAAEVHRDLVRGVLDLERGGRCDAIVPRLLRLAHTLKGAARVVRQREIADHCHAIEEVLVPLRESAGAVERDVVETLLRRVDDVGAHVASLQKPAEAAEPAATASSTQRAAADEAPRTVRADLDDLDVVLDGLGEAQVALGALRRTNAAMERIRHLTEVLVEQLARPHGQAGERAAAVAREIHGAVSEVERRIATEVDQADHELAGVREAAEQMRLVPAQELFAVLDRTVRDAAHAQGKSVLFTGRGGDVRLAGQVIEVVQGAMVQLARNAVAHGIELPAERSAAGKPREGVVAVEVARRGRRVAFTCRDDGRGVDVEGLRRAARRRGASDSGRESLVDLLLRSGASTSGTITEIAGRGIGLDVLRDAAERLGGEVDVTTGAGVGTVFELVVPLALAALEVLNVEVAGTALLLPLDAVRRSLRLAASDVISSPEGELVMFSGSAVPFVPLSRLLELDGGGAAVRDWTAVVVEGAEGLAVLGVEALVGTAHVVQRPLPELAPSTSTVGGVSLDANGNPRLVLDVDGLVVAARRAGASVLRAESRRTRILVVDDSLTTRMLEQNILEAAGYEVGLAVSAEDALEKLGNETFALILVDVEMPGMDGFTFVEHTRRDPVTRDIPCILVTSRASVADRRRGREAGARGYVDKGAFDQNDLLAQIRGLLT